MRITSINTIIDTILFYLLSVTLAALVSICFTQVVARYVFKAAFTWAEEVSIILMLWATWVAACLAVKQDTHIRIRFLEERLKPRSRLIIRLGVKSLSILFLTVIALASKLVLAAMENMTLMSLPSVPLNIIYLSVPCGCVLMIYYLLRSMAGDWQALHIVNQEES